ncbi:Transcription factor fungi [Macrophomina phaseolina MS6]|uniref:Transcription factor fungi n=1 Tax=Macrophomina phaseolina (strain MS6) TaxID=1126212 RepID=K2T0M0_MACPH|nr:Transcription factor fungi [Macrophomina phaseolina MS6]
MQRQETELRLLPALSDPMHLSGWKKREKQKVRCCSLRGRTTNAFRVVERGDRLLQLLREASTITFLPPHIMNELKALESEVGDDDQSLASTNTTTAQKRPRTPSAQRDEEKRPRHGSPQREGGGEADAIAGEVGSEESIDINAEDFNRSEQTKAMGFVGKHSEVLWAQRLASLQTESANNAQTDGVNAQMDETPVTRTQGNRSIVNFSYHQDNYVTLKLNHVEKDELPPLELASRLVECFINNVHDFFPILIKPDFASQFQSCVRSGNPGKAPPIWRGILNIVFAIGAKFSHLVGATWRGDERDHLLYHTRALQLSPLNEDTVVLPDLQRIQMMGLTSFYYLTVGQISRSWIMLGLACRQAVALGLHLRNLAPTLTAASREKRARVWWALYYLEYLLCENTGRPTMINSQFCSIQPLAPLDEAALTTFSGNKQLEDWYRTSGEPSAKQAKRQSFVELDSAPSPINQFRSRVNLAVLTQKAFSNLYSAATISKSWQRTQSEIVTLSREIDEWYSCLPLLFKFTLEISPGDGRFTRDRMILGFCYYSAKMLINRPCLCRVDTRIENQTSRSKEVDQERARECIMAAKSVADLLPHKSPTAAADVLPDVVWLYNNGPWWCIVHYFMQAITVLMLELAFGEFHLRGERMGAAGSADITAVVGKLVRWLGTMAATGNAAAIGACRQVRQQFEGFRPSNRLNLAELFRNLDIGPDVVRRRGGPKFASGKSPPREQHQQQPPQEQDDIRMRYVSSEGVMYGATSPAAAGLQGPDEFAEFGLPFLPEQQFSFGEPWDVRENMVDWNNLFFDNPYDVYNPFLQVNQTTEGDVWTGSGHGAGLGGSEMPRQEQYGQGQGKEGQQQVLIGQDAGTGGGPLGWGGGYREQGQGQGGEERRG